MPDFQDRQPALNLICTDVDQPALLNVYGESGIGKSRLLDEASQRLRANSPPAIVLHIDLEPLVELNQTKQQQQVLQVLIQQAEDWLSGYWQTTDRVASEIVVQLNRLARNKKVFLMFDTTEVFQEDMAFWQWMEENLVGPLVNEGNIRQVFAGRIPVPWRRVEVRRAVKLLPLEPLPIKDDARKLVQEILQENNSVFQADNSKTEDATQVVLEFSLGHPYLSEKLAAYVAQHWPPPDLNEFKRELCKEIVEPLIDQEFFKNIVPPWDKILWWASILDWFDETVLQQYLKRIDEDLIKGKPDFFFIKGISRLRIQNTVVWRGEQGDRLHGVIGDIVRHCLEVMRPDDYRTACLKAAETMEALAGEFPDNDPDAEQYFGEANTYRQRAEMEEEK
jgi:hypothetical protein